MGKVRVPVAGTIGKSIAIDPLANQGAQIGVDLFMPDGSVATIEQLAALLAIESTAPGDPITGDLSPTIWGLIGEIPDNINEAAALNSVGILVRQTDGSWITRSVTAGSNKVTVTNGDGDTGAPTIDVAESNINHNSLANYVSDQHVAHSNVDIVAGAGLTGGGNIAASRTLDVGAGTGITVNANDVALSAATIDAINDGLTAFGWGNHASVGYLTSETDPVFGASAAAGIDAGDISDWNTAYGWGNHASAGYALDSDVVHLTGDESVAGNKTFTGATRLQSAAGGTGAMLTSSTSYTSGTLNMPRLQWREADGTFHADFRAFTTTGANSYLELSVGTSFSQDFLFSDNGAFTAQGVITADSGDSDDWSAAFGWGNHASGGYAADSGVVHLAGTETITGAKSFNANSTVFDADGTRPISIGASITQNATTGNSGQLDLNANPDDGTSPSSIRLHRSTNTTGATNVTIYYGDGATNSYAQFASINGTSSRTFSIYNGTNQWIRDGGYLRIYDSSDTDYGQFSHDGTDFNAAFTNTTDWNITGLNVLKVGTYFFDVDQTVGAGQDNYVLTYDNSSGLISLEAAAGGGGGISNVVEDTTPQLGGDLDGNGFDIDITDGNNITIFDSTNTDTMQFRHDGTGARITMTNSSYLAILGGVGLQVYDSSGADFVSMQHDGTNFTHVFTNTANLDFTALTGAVRIRDGASLYIYDTTDSDSGRFYHDGTNFNAAFTGTNVVGLTGASFYTFDNDAYITGGVVSRGLISSSGVDEQITFMDVNGAVGRVGSYNWGAAAWQEIQLQGSKVNIDSVTGPIELSAASGSDWFELISGTGMRIRDAGSLRVYDSADTDYAQFSHNGTDFTTSFVNTEDWQLTGIVYLDLISDTGLRVRDSTNTDYITIDHNGTDCIFNYVNTTWQRFTNLGSGILIQDGAVVRVYDSTDTDYAEINHDGTDFNIYFANTTRLDINGQFYVRASNGGTGITSAAQVDDHAGTARDVGYNVLPTGTADASVTLAAEHCGHTFIKTTTTARTLTIPASSNVDFPVGGVCTILNVGSSNNITVSDDVTATCYVLTGSAVTDIAGSATIAPGGVATLYRVTSDTYYLFGSGITP